MLRVILPLAVTCTLLIGAACAIRLLAAPKPKSAYLTLSCDTIPLPESIGLNVGDLLSLHFRATQATISNIRTIQTLDKQHNLRTDALDRVLLRPVDGLEATASFLLREKGRPGNHLLHVNEGTHVRAERRPDNGVDLVLQLVGKSAELTLQSEALEVLEFNRMRLEPAPFPASAAQAASPFSMSNRISMVTATFRAVPMNGSENAEFRLSFPPSAAVALLEPPATLSSIANKKISFQACEIEQLALMGSPAPDVAVKRRSITEAIIGSGFTWEEIRVAPNGSALLLKAKGELRSLSQDNRQVLPSALSELWNASPAQKGIAGGLALFCLFAGGVFLKRALEVLSKAALPEITRK